MIVLLATKRDMQKTQEYAVDIIIEPIAEQRNEDASEIVRAIQLAVAAYLTVFNAEQLPVIS